MPRLCVYLGATFGHSPVHRQVAAEFGTLCVRHGVSIVYGGGRVGLMGELANAALAAGGEVIGVIPEVMIQQERAHHGVTRLIPVRSMHERKLLMAEMSDAFVALPGGIGTLEEIMEVFTWLQLGIHLKPVGLLNINGYYDPLLSMLDRMCEDGFLESSHRGMLSSAQDPETLLAALLTTRHAMIEKPVEPAP